MFKCPRCGQKLEFARPELTFRQRRILYALELHEHELARPVSVTLLLDDIGVGRATLKNELAHLEHLKHVYRPNGPKSGWSIFPDEEIKLVISLAS